MYFRERDAGKVTPNVVLLFCFLFLVIILSIPGLADAAHYNTTISETSGGTTLIPYSSDVITVDQDGLHAANPGSVISADDELLIATTGYSASGAHANNDGTILIGNSADISTSGQSARGAIAQDNSNIRIGESANIATSGLQAFGTFATANSNMEIGNNATITTSGYAAYCAYALDSSNIKFGSFANFTTSDGMSNGVWAYNDSNIEIGNSASITTLGQYARGVFATQSNVSIGNSADITTNGNYSYGLYATAHASMDIGDNSTITTSGEDAYGAYAYNYSSIDIGNYAVITTSGDTATGALAENRSNINIGEYTSIKTLGAEAHGAHANNYGTILIGSSADITTSGDAANGVYVSTKSSMDIGDYATITTSGEGANGVYALESSNITIGTSADITTSGDNAIGTFAENGSNINIGNRAAITTEGYGAYGSYSFSNSSVDIGDYAAITTSGDTAAGAYARYYSSIGIGDYAAITTSGDTATGALAEYNSNINIGDHAAITTSDFGSHGAYAYHYSSMDIGDHATITTSEAESSGAYAVTFSSMDIGDYATIRTSGLEAHGVYADQCSIMDIGNFAKITTLGDQGFGIYADLFSDLYIGNNATITTSGISAHGAHSNTSSVVKIGSDATIATYGYSSYGVYAEYQSNINIGEGANISTTGIEAHALFADNGGSIKLDGAAISVSGADSLAVCSEFGSQVTGTGTFNITGDMYADGAGGTENTLIDFTLENNSIFTGKTSYTSNDAVTALNLNLLDADALWVVTGNSDLTNLDNAGTVYFKANPDYMTVTAEELGSRGVTGGVFDMKMDVMTLNHDLLAITNTAAGDYIITAQANDGSLATTGNERFNMVEIGGPSSATFALTNDMELGAWKYSIHEIPFGSAAGTAWEIYGTGLSTPAEGAIQTLMGSYMLAYAETTLIQRMGDLRQSPHLSGVWVRTYGGNSETKTTKNLSSTADMDFWGVNIGYDRKIDTKWSGEAYYGAFFGYSEGDMSYSTGGSGNITSTMVGLYATYIHPNGFYADSVLKYRWRESDFNTYDSVGAQVWSNEITTGGFGWSLELGQRISFNGTPKSGWYAEPQVQIRHQRHDEGYYNLSNGLRIGTDGFTSIIGRVGTLIGYETENKNFYAKVFRAREFDGDMNVYANGVRIEESFGGSWWIYGLGMTAKINDKNNLYLDLERTSGNESFDQKWRLNAGWRMEF